MKPDQKDAALPSSDGRGVEVGVYASANWFWNRLLVVRCLPCRQPENEFLRLQREIYFALSRPEAWLDEYERKSGRPTRREAVGAFFIERTIVEPDPLQRPVHVVEAGDSDMSKDNLPMMALLVSTCLNRDNSGKASFPYLSNGYHWTSVESGQSSAGYGIGQILRDKHGRGGT